MNLWLKTEIQMRRDDALESARCCRLARLAASGRSTRVRVRIAAVAQAISDMLAGLARTLRNGETA